MAAISGLAAAVAWTGYTGLYASPGIVKPYMFSLSVQGGALETTGFGGSAVISTTKIAAPYSWSGSITCRSPNTVQTGYSGSVAWSVGTFDYATNIREWNLDLTCGEKLVTAFNGTGVVAHSYIPLAWSWRGGFTGYHDGTTPPDLPDIPTNTLSTITLMALNTTTDDTLSGSCVVTQLGVDVGVADGTADVAYSFEGTGGLTAAGTDYGVASTGIWSSGSLVTPTPGSLVLTAASGRTYTGDAFPTGVSWRVGVADVIETVISFRGTGALSIA